MPSIDLTQHPSTDPLEIYRYRDGLYSTDLLAAALVHLDLFSRFQPGPNSLQSLCKDLGILPRPTEVMLTLFTAMGFLRRCGDLFELTATAQEHLVSRSPWFIGPYYASVKDRPVTLDYVTVLKSDRPANWSSAKDQQAWAKAMEQPAFARQFTAAMDCRGRYLGQALAKRIDPGSRRRLLDVAGGSGIYACCLAAEHSQLEATVLEKAPVDQIARDAIVSRGFKDRVTVTRGDMFEQPWPEGYDLHLLSNVIHDWDVPRVKSLLKHSFDSLASGGLLLIHDMHLNAEKTGPLPVAQYSALLMNITEGRCYSVKEMTEFLTEAGFGEPTWLDTAADRSVLVAEKRRPY